MSTVIRHVNTYIRPSISKIFLAACSARNALPFRKITTSSFAGKVETNVIPPRKRLKDEAKLRKQEKQSQKGTQKDDLDANWELTVGIEIHARLNTTSKLFSAAKVEVGGNELPNQNVAEFDAALPGSQPILQKECLIPAIRAALALNCQVQQRSGWDRKHYFYQDQPNGYQITQYYDPLAVDGHISLPDTDNLKTNNLPSGNVNVRIGIKQVQMEQDTAKTITLDQNGSTNHLIDYNRVGSPLIEIITNPEIHSPVIAVAVVRKIRHLLRSVDACTGDMENGDLRADVNVSVRPRNTPSSSPLGSRTEIKNLNSFKSIHDAVTSEYHRQVRLLSSNQKVESETRAWCIGGTSTTLLRKKDGEIDYRYMPDPDLHPVIISPSLIQTLRDSLPESPDDSVKRIISDFGITVKDARILLTIDDGERLEFISETCNHVKSLLDTISHDEKEIGRTVTNWTLHELGGLATPFEELHITPNELAEVVVFLLGKKITGRSAKSVVQQISLSTPSPPCPSSSDSTFSDNTTPIDRNSDGRDGLVVKILNDQNMWIKEMSDEEYTTLARSIITSHPEEVARIKQKGQVGKIMFFVGLMVKNESEGRVDARRAKQVFEREITAL